METETLAETIESDPLCITDLFQNKSVAYFLFIHNKFLINSFICFLDLYYVTFQFGRKNIFIKI
jgi:hypothetical protein